MDILVSVAADGMIITVNEDLSEVDQVLTSKPFFGIDESTPMQFEWTQDRTVGVLIPVVLHPVRNDLDCMRLDDWETYMMDPDAVVAVTERGELIQDCAPALVSAQQVAGASCGGAGASCGCAGASCGGTGASCGGAGASCGGAGASCGGAGASCGGAGASCGGASASCGGASYTGASYTGASYTGAGAGASTNRSVLPEGTVLSASVCVDSLPDPFLACFDAKCQDSPSDLNENDGTGGASESKGGDLTPLALRSKRVALVMALLGKGGSSLTGSQSAVQMASYFEAKGFDVTSIIDQKEPEFTVGHFLHKLEVDSKVAVYIHAENASLYCEATYLTSGFGKMSAGVWFLFFFPMTRVYTMLFCFFLDSFTFQSVCLWTSCWMIFTGSAWTGPCLFLWMLLGPTLWDFVGTLNFCRDDALRKYCREVFIF